MPINRNFNRHTRLRGDTVRRAQPNKYEFSISIYRGQHTKVFPSERRARERVWYMWWWRFLIYDKRGPFQDAAHKVGLPRIWQVTQAHL